MTLPVEGCTLAVFGGAQQHLIEFLKDKYSRRFAQFYPLPWNDTLTFPIEEVYTRLEVIESTGSLSVFTSNTLSHEHDVFKDIVVNRFEIKGAPAIGKYTFCKKLAYDWARGSLSQFNLVYLVEMRHVNADLIDDIYNELPDDDKINRDDLKQIINRNQHSFLLLVDGFEIISRKKFPNSMVLETTRPMESNIDGIDDHYQIPGFNKWDSYDYVTKYFKQYKLPLAEMNESLDEMIISPLHVSFLCVLWTDYDNKRHLPNCLSELYQEMLECILKKSCEAYLSLIRVMFQTRCWFL
ncbi:uncharacterized protein LOC144364098 [Saccoglossus kowalevskii]